MTTNTNGGTLTVVGTTTSPAGSVTVNGSNAALYDDSTIAATNMPLDNTYTAIASDSYGRSSISTVNLSIGTNSGFEYDGNLVIQERDINNLPNVTYTRRLDLSRSIEGAGGIGGLLARASQVHADASVASQSYCHCDAFGNVTMLTDSKQGIVAKYLYDAFGNTLSKSGLLADANLYRFSSKEGHANSGLAYYLYRYYDPNLQRWPNRDPLGESGWELLHSRKFDVRTEWLNTQISRHRQLLAYLGYDPLRLMHPDLIGDGPDGYAFELNDPLNHFDPDGRSLACIANLSWCLGGLLLTPEACLGSPLTCAGTVLAGPVAGCLAAYDSCLSGCPNPPHQPVFHGK